MPFVQLAVYGAVVIGIAAMIAKVVRYVKAPEHFRWELYPVPHEKGRADYGGSYLEELDWWTQPRQTDMFKEVIEMGEEILLLKGVYKHNRKVWSFSLPFHLGMYICIGWQLLLVVGAILQYNGVAISGAGSGPGLIIHYATIICGYAALILTGFGALGLFFWRLGDSRQRPYNAPIEYVNLLLFVAAVAVGLINHLGGDPSFAGLRNFAEAVVTFGAAPPVTGWLAAEILLGALLIMYIPLTRMSHFVAKYFLYHSIRWNDEPNPRGSKIEKRIAELLNQKVGWNAPHIQTGSRWADVVKEMKDE